MSRAKIIQGLSLTRKTQLTTPIWNRKFSILLVCFALICLEIVPASSFKIGHHYHLIHHRHKQPRNGYVDIYFSPFDPLSRLASLVVKGFHFQFTPTRPTTNRPKLTTVNPHQTPSTTPGQYFPTHYPTHPAQYPGQFKPNPTPHPVTQYPTGPTQLATQYPTRPTQHPAQFSTISTTQYPGQNQHLQGQTQPPVQHQVSGQAQTGQQPSQIQTGQQNFPAQTQPGGQQQFPGQIQPGQQTFPGQSVSGQQVSGNAPTHLATAQGGQPAGFGSNQPQFPQPNPGGNLLYPSTSISPPAQYAPNQQYTNTPPPQIG